MTDDLSFSWSVAARRVTMAASDPASALQPIRDRAGIVAKLGPPRPGGDLAGAAHRSAADVPRLLKAVEDVLKLTEPTGEVHRDLDGNEEGGVVRVVRCDVLREAITAALAGKEAGDADPR